MYLLDNHRKNVELNVLKKISDVKSINDLINVSSEKLDGLNYFFKQIDYSLRCTPLVDSKRTRENITKLFTNPPLSMELNSKELNDILSIYLKDPKSIKLDSNPFNNQSGLITTIFNNELGIVKTYKELLLEKLKTNTTMSSYDIVGQVTSNFNSLFYGKQYIDKSIMNIFLTSIEKENNLKTNNDNLDIDKLKDYCEKHNFHYNQNSISETINNIQYALTEEKQSLNNLKEMEYTRNISKLKHSAFKNIKKEVLNILNFDQNVYHEFNKLLFKITGKKINDKSLSSLDIYESLDLIHYDLRDEIKNIKFSDNQSDKKELLKDLINLDDKLNLLIPKVKNIINKKDEYFNFENKRTDVSPDDIRAKENKYITSLKEFQIINQSFLNSNSLDKSKYILKEIESSNLLNNETKKDFFKLTKELIKSIHNLDKYDINEIKQFLYLSLSNNKTIYGLLKNSNMFDNLINNNFIKEILSKKIIIESKDFDIKRLKYVLDIMIFNKDIETLFTKDININIKNMFFSKVGLEINSENGNSKLKEVLKLLESKQSELNIKNTNILLGIILNSYENFSFNIEKFNSFISCLNTPVNRLDKEQKDLINSIDDKWLKWGIVYNREIKDKNVFMSSINPMNFEFNKMQTIKKIIEKNNPNKEFNKYDYNLYYFLTKNSNNLEQDVENLSKALNEFKDNFLSTSNSKKVRGGLTFNVFRQKINKLKTPEENFNSLIYLFNRSLENVLNSKIPFIQSKLNNIKDVSENILSSMNEIILLSRLENFLTDERIKESKIEPKDALQILNSNKHLGSIIKNVSNEVYLNILDNIDALPKLSKESYKRYINYYETMSDKYNFKQFDTNTCNIPVIEKNMGNGYSYKVKTIKDFDVLLTGEKTNCCMTFGNAGWNIYQHMYEHPKSNVIFEVYKNGKVVANSWTWFEKDQVCFDNIEVLGNELRDSIVDCYKDASIRFVTENKDINLVTFGLGHTDITYSSLGTQSKNYEDFVWKNVYTDSRNQLAIVSKNTNNIDKDLMLEKLNNSNVDKNLILKLNDVFYQGEINYDQLRENKSNKRNNVNIDGYINDFINNDFFDEIAF